MMLEMRGSEGIKVRIKDIRFDLLASLVCKASADSFPEFDDIEIQQLKESLEIAVRRPIVTLYEQSGLKAKDTMRIFLATTPDNSTRKWRSSSPK